jgi:hypothetical protein
VGEVRDVQDENKMSAHDLGIHLPPPSFWPIVLAAGITLIFVGLIFRRVDGPLPQPVVPDVRGRAHHHPVDVRLGVRAGALRRGDRGQG